MTSRRIGRRRRRCSAPTVGYSAFFYPPPYLLVCLPLALLPYFASLIVWLAATGAAYWRVLRAWAGPRLDAAVLLAFPAFLVNAGHGQNGFLSAALIGAGALWLDRRPIVAGLMFGALAYKPQLALMIPIALIASRRWTTFAAAAVSAAALCAASYLIWGEPVWRGFLDASPLARAALERHLVGDEKMQSVFAAVRLLRGPLALAYAAQAATALAAAAALFWLQRRDFRGLERGAGARRRDAAGEPLPARLRPDAARVPARLSGARGARARLRAVREERPHPRLSAAARVADSRRRARSAHRRADHRRYALFRRLPPAGRTGAGRAIDRNRRIIE